LILEDLLPDGIGYALTAIAQPLETGEQKKKKKKAKTTTKAIDVFALVPAAAAYFIICPHKIRQACESETNGFSVARWDNWKSQFAALGSEPQAGDEARAACQDAISTMEKYEA
jgi:hypothetical protein